MIAKGIVRRFEIRSNTPKAFANFSPAVGAKRQPWVRDNKKRINPERLGVCWNNPFKVQTIVVCAVSQGCRLRSNRWAEISERLRRIHPKSKN